MFTIILNNPNFFKIKKKEDIYIKDYEKLFLIEMNKMGLRFATKEYELRKPPRSSKLYE